MRNLFLILVLVLLSACGKPDGALSKYPVSDNFSCTKSQAECFALFYDALSTWYGDTSFTLKQCDLYPGFCSIENKYELETAYRGY